jgi:hypothetical protein
MGVDPDGRLAFLVVLAIVIIVSALAAGTTTAVMQYNAGAGWSSINWGSVFLSAGIGAASGAVSCGVGAVVAPAVGAALGTTLGAGTAATVGTVTGAAAGGAAGGAASYGLRHTGGGFSWGVFGRSVAIGGIAGVTGAGAGLSAAAQGAGAGWSAAAAGLGGSVGAYGGSVYIGGQAASWQSFGLSVGVGLASAVAAGNAMNWAAGRGAGQGPTQGGSSPGGKGQAPAAAGPSEDPAGTPGGDAAEGNAAPKERYSGRYADGQRAYRTNVPRDENGMPAPDPGSVERPVDGAHSRLQFDKKDPSRVYSATEFDENGQPVRRIDFAARSGQELPHEHVWIPGTNKFSDSHNPLMLIARPK